MAKGTISSVNWNTTAFDKSDGGTLSVTVNYNEQVDVTGTPQFTVTNDTPARNVVLDYASGTGTNRLTFTKAIAANNAATDAGDVLSLGTNAVALNGGTVKDKGENLASNITTSSPFSSSSCSVTKLERYFIIKMIGFGSLE